MKLDVYYDGETDTLSLWNGKPASGGADVAENLTVDLDEEGEAVGFTLEHASEVLKEIVARPFAVWPPEGFALAGSELLTEMLKAVGKRSVIVGNPQGLTLADNESPPEMLKAVGEYPFVVLNPEGLTPEVIEKWGGRSVVWIPRTGHFADSEKK